MKKNLSIIIILLFSWTNIFLTGNISAQTLLPSSTAYIPPLIKGMVINPQQPFQFDFIIDSGSKLLENEQLQKESEKLIKYFLVSMTLPEDDLWVNLSPYESNRIIPDQFGLTTMGQELLAQDYLLKQLTSSMLNPEHPAGEKFWDKVNEKVQKQFGTIDIPIDTFNKVWIIPNQALLYENKDRVFITQSHLKVMLEKDYVAAREDVANPNTSTQPSKLSTPQQEIAEQVLREIIIPELEKEINSGEQFSQLRQIYHSFILAVWFKKNLKKALLNTIYANKRKTSGLDVADQANINIIYKKYVQLFKNGTHNFIREEYDPASGEIIPKKYFSGGVKLKADIAMINQAPQQVGEINIVTTNLLNSQSEKSRSSIDQAMLTKRTNPDDLVNHPLYNIEIIGANEQQSQILRSWLEELKTIVPPYLSRHLTTIEVIKDAEDEFWIEDSSRGKLNIKSGSFENWPLEAGLNMLAHELAHTLYLNSPQLKKVWEKTYTSPRIKNTQRNLLIAIPFIATLPLIMNFAPTYWDILGISMLFTSYSVLTDYLNEKFISRLSVSQYGLEDHFEDFAESFRIFIFQNTAFKNDMQTNDRFAKKYLILDKLFSDGLIKPKQYEQYQNLRSELNQQISSEGIRPILGAPIATLVKRSVTKFQRDNNPTTINLQILLRQVLDEDKKLIIKNILKSYTIDHPIQHISEQILLTGNLIKTNANFSTENILERLYSLVGDKIETFKINTQQAFHTKESHEFIIVKIPGYKSAFIVDNTFRQYMTSDHPMKTYFKKRKGKRVNQALEHLLRYGFVNVSDGFFTAYVNAFTTVDNSPPHSWQWNDFIKEEYKNNFEPEKLYAYFSEKDIENGIREYEIFAEERIQSLREIKNNPKKPVGGIDLHEEYLNIQTTGNKIELNLESLPTIENIQIDGLIPIILKITPIQNLISILGT